MGTGIAVRCGDGGVCASTEVGMIEFDRGAPGADLLGSYRLNFSGEALAGTFRAVWSDRPAICG